MSVCVSKCIIFFLDQNDTLTSQRLIHHSIAKLQSDIYGRLMLLISYSCVPQGKKRLRKQNTKNDTHWHSFSRKDMLLFFSFLITKVKIGVMSMYLHVQHHHW